MKHEVRFNSFSDRGEPNLHVDLNTFIKLFVNHRPVYGIGKNNIDDAFKAIIEELNDDVGGDSISSEQLQLLLARDADGEEIQTEELQKLLGQLVSETRISKALGEEINAERFAEEILGFEEVDEHEGEDDEDAEGEPGAEYNQAGASKMSKLGVI